MSHEPLSRAALLRLSELSANAVASYVGHELNNRAHVFQLDASFLAEVWAELTAAVGSARLETLAGLPFAEAAREVAEALQSLTRQAKRLEAFATELRPTPPDLAGAHAALGDAAAAAAKRLDPGATISVKAEEGLPDLALPLADLELLLLLPLLACPAGPVAVEGRVAGKSVRATLHPGGGDPAPSATAPPVKAAAWLARAYRGSFELKVDPAGAPSFVLELPAHAGGSG